MKIRLKQGSTEIRCELLNTTDGYFVVIKNGVITYYDRHAWLCYIVKERAKKVKED